MQNNKKFIPRNISPYSQPIMKKETHKKFKDLAHNLDLPATELFHRISLIDFGVLKKYILDNYAKD